MSSADEIERTQVRLPEQKVMVTGVTSTFEIGPLSKPVLIEGIDEIGLLQSYSANKAAFDSSDAAKRPWVRMRAAR